MRVFVAGGSGALGRRVVARLSRAGHDVRATARDAAAADVVTTSGGVPVEVDLFDAQALRRAVAGCDAVLRLTTAVPGYLKMRRAAAWAETGRLRNEGAWLLAGACVREGVPTYIHESTSVVYADGGDRWLDEDSPVDDANTAPLHDALTGEANASLVDDAGGRGIVLRFAGMYAADSPQTLAMAALLHRLRLRLIGPSRNFVSSIHLDDAASATVAAMAAPSGVYNVADNEPLPLREYIAYLARAIDAPPIRRVPALLGPFIMGEAWQYLRRSQRVSARRLHDATGWTPSIPDARRGWELVGLQWAAETSRA
jgi:nucleoside-diphosphate-sugar epimerase